MSMSIETAMVSKYKGRKPKRKKKTMGKTLLSQEPNPTSKKNPRAKKKKDKVHAKNPGAYSKKY